MIAKKGKEEELFLSVRHFGRAKNISFTNKRGRMALRGQIKLKGYELIPTSEVMLGDILLKGKQWPGCSTETIYGLNDRLEEQDFLFKENEKEKKK